ncbi:MAG: ATP-binding protein [Syntrophobacteraceae bacterium]
MHDHDHTRDSGAELERLRLRISELEAAETRRKAAESALRDQLHFFQELIDTIPNPIFYKDNNALYLGCNKAFEARTGVRRENIVGKRAQDLFPPDLAARYEEIDTALLRKPGEHVIETTLRYADGLEHHVLIDKGTFTDAEGNLAGLVGVTIDITDRKMAEEALKEAHDQLEIRVRERTGELAKANEELRFEIAEREKAEKALLAGAEKLKLFAYSVAHDLKSPAIGIYGLTGLLHRQYRDTLDERGGTICDQIQRASEHVVSLVEEINVFIASKEAPLHFERFNAREVFGVLRDEFSTRFTIRQIEWSTPETTPEVKADRLSMTRVFRNLVDNALKYGGEKLSRIAVQYRESDDFHIFSVIDDGVGLQKEGAEKIFGLFQRHDASKGVEGAGLGLAIVKEIVERHGGTVKVESSPGGGTAFHVSISKNP